MNVCAKVVAVIKWYTTCTYIAHTFVKPWLLTVSIRNLVQNAVFERLRLWDLKCNIWIIYFEQCLCHIAFRNTYHERTQFNSNPSLTHNDLSKKKVLEPQNCHDAFDWCRTSVMTQLAMRWCGNHSPCNDVIMLSSLPVNNATESVTYVTSMELHVIHEVVTWNNNATNATAAPNVNLSIPRSIFVDINGWLCVLLFVVSMVGIFCNCLGFLVALQPAFRRVPIAPFLICMSITDTVFLYTAVINTSWMFLKGGPIPGPTAMCNIRRLLSTVSGASSALVLATLSAQRFCCLLVPHKVKPWLKTRLSVATVCVIVGSSVAAFSPILWAVAADSSCKVQPGWETYFAYTYSGMAMTTYTIIPDATMMVTNSWTMRELIRINRLRGQVHPATAGTAGKIN